MKREDIIGQKLFETYKLSEFYLNLIVNNTLEEESPLQLANAFTHKLFEIAERYDRLLEANKQKENFTLSFDHTRSSTQIIKHKPPLTPTISLGRCSTPNKSLHLINTNIHSASSTPSEPPSTPSYLNTFFRKSNSNLSLNKHWNVSTSNLNMMSRKQSHKHYYTRQLANTTKNSSGASSRANSNETNARNQVKLCQRIASIYYGSESEDELEVNNQTNETASDDMDIKYDYTYRNELKFDNDILKYINESSDAANKKGQQLNEHDLLVTSTSSSSNSSAASTSSSSSAASNHYECSINSDNNSTLSGNLNETSINTPVNIGKSYSNLSKDSGVFMSESFHSNVNTRLFKNEESGIENEEDDGEEEFQGKNFNSPSSQELNESEEQYEYDDSSNITVTNKIKTEFKQNQKNTTALHQQLIWNQSNPTVPIIKQETSTQNQIPRPIPSLKEQFLKNHPVDSKTYRKPSHDIRTRLMQSEFTSKIKYFNNNNFNNAVKPVSVETSNFNFDLATKGIEPGLMSMMIDSNNDGHFNLNNSSELLNNNDKNYSASDDNLSKTQLISTNKTDNNNNNNRNDSGLFFNNSLMNVSMLDNIQATNNLDFMSSSILTFE